MLSLDSIDSLDNQSRHPLNFCQPSLSTALQSVINLSGLSEGSKLLTRVPTMKRRHPNIRESTKFSRSIEVICRDFTSSPTDIFNNPIFFEQHHSSSDTSRSIEGKSQQVLHKTLLDNMPAKPCSGDAQNNKRLYSSLQSFSNESLTLEPAIRKLACQETTTITTITPERTSLTMPFSLQDSLLRNPSKELSKLFDSENLFPTSENGQFLKNYPAFKVWSNNNNKNNNYNNNCPVQMTASVEEEKHEDSLKQCQLITEQTQIHSIFTDMIASSMNSSTTSVHSTYEMNCREAFVLNQLTETQLLQFRFSLYKKKGNPNQNCTSKDMTTGVSRFGKYHNFNKLFMYNILSMFSVQNLADLGVPKEILFELQTMISRIKSSAKNNYRVAGKYAFDYFSHAHYNILFFKVDERNLRLIQSQREYVDLYEACFHIDITQPLTSIQISYLNIVKLYAYHVFMSCIAHTSIVIDPLSNTQENLKNQYTMKVVKGVQKLAAGILIKRF